MKRHGSVLEGCRVCAGGDLGKLDAHTRGRCVSQGDRQTAPANRQSLGLQGSLAWM